MLSPFRAALSALCLLFTAAPALAQGDLLVAPTRLVLNDTSASEVAVSNSGNQTTTYRISLVLRRMDENGQIRSIEESEASPSEAAALAMLNYAPRRITLAPQQSQTVRVGLRPPADLPAGEYRAHLLFRAVPPTPEAAPAPAPDQPPAEGMSISLTPIYGVAIPLIARIGAVTGAARIERATVDKREDEAGVMLVLGRSGGRSVYGTVELLPVGKTKPVAMVKGIAVYPEIERRSLFVPLDAEGLAAARSGLIARFTETGLAGKPPVVEARVGWNEAGR